MLIPGTHASWVSGLELGLGLLITGLLLAGVRQAWRGAREAHVRTMRRLPPLMGLFLLVFLVNALARRGVEALASVHSGPLLLGLLVLHVALSLGGGLLLVLVIRWGRRGESGGFPQALQRHRRWGGFTAGFWLVNTLLGALVFWGAYVQ